MKDNIIRCPICKREYLAEEIYTSILGDPKTILRDSNGKIVYYDGDSLDLEEEYTCDNCNTTFRITGNITFKTQVYDEHNFKEDFKIKI